MRLFGALITPTTLSLPCRRRKTAVVRSTTARCRLSSVGSPSGASNMPLRTATWAAPAWWPRGTMRTLPLLDRRELLRPRRPPRRRRAQVRAARGCRAARNRSRRPCRCCRRPGRRRRRRRQPAIRVARFSLPQQMGGREAAEAPEIIDCTALASPSSMRKDRERVRRRYHAPRAHKRARARRNGWPSSPRMPHNGRETPEVRRHDALSTGLVKPYFVGEK